MERYKITPRTQKIADRLGVIIYPSGNKYKKLAVWKGNKLIGHVGDTRYNDFHTYIELEKDGKVPAGTAREKKRLFTKRNIHAKRKFSKAWYTQQLLWT